MIITERWRVGSGRRCDPILGEALPAMIVPNDFIFGPAEHDSTLGIPYRSGVVEMRPTACMSLGTLGADMLDCYARDRYCCCGNPWSDKIDFYYAISSIPFIFPLWISRFYLNWAWICLVTFFCFSTLLHKNRTLSLIVSVVHFLYFLFESLFQARDSS